MAKKKPSKKKYALNISKWKYPQLKSEAIAKGIDPEVLYKMTIPQIQQWLEDHYEVEPDKSLILTYEKDREEKLKARGKTPETHPHLFNSSLAPIKTKVKSSSKKRSKKDGDSPQKKTSNSKPSKKSFFGEEGSPAGLRPGTKKELAYKCYKDGLDMEEGYKEIISEFGDVSKKSLRIWYNRAKKHYEENPEG